MIVRIYRLRWSIVRENSQFRVSPRTREISFAPLLVMNFSLTSPRWIFRSEICLETRCALEAKKVAPTSFEEVKQARRSIVFRSGTSAVNDLLI